MGIAFGSFYPAVLKQLFIVAEVPIVFSDEFYTWNMYHHH